VREAVEQASRHPSEAVVIDLGRYRVWFVVGSQDLYGDDALATVADHTQQPVAALNAVDCLPFPIEYRPVLKTADAITATMQQANAEPDCIGVIAWMHTFSPAKMWTAGLQTLRRPLLHLHTQFNRDIPWPDIDMDFMNLNQSAHGDREFGFICTAWASTARSSSVTMRRPPSTRASPLGCAPRPPTATPRRCASPDSATTCAASR
jgi:L-arabinose isomerase